MGSDTNNTGNWGVTGPGVSASNYAPGGWSVSGNGPIHLTVSIPSTAPPGVYTAYYIGGWQLIRNGDGSGIGTGPQVQFQVFAAPPTKPTPASGPAFSWQGSIGGVNTGNGNKLTTIPLVGWTQRGGMSVSCTMYHNSQGPNYGSYGYKWLISYYTYLTSDGSGNPTIHWDNGLTYTFTKNSDGSYTPPYGILDKLTVVNNIFVLTTPNNTKYTFGFGSGILFLTSITDLDGNTLTINHNANATISSVVDATNRMLTYAYDANANLTTVTDPLGRQWGIGIGGGRYLGSIQLPPVNGQTNSLYFGYGDGRQNLTSFQNARGYGSWFAYNSDNSLASAQDALGNVTTYTYNPTTTVITDPNGHTTTHTYAYSRLASVTDALNKTETYSYDWNNILTNRKDKRGYNWRFSSHFSNGQPTSTSTDALGYASTATYDSLNKVISSADALGNTTKNTYSTDGHEDLLSSKVTGTGTSPFQATSTVSGYANGLPTAFADPLGDPSTVSYDANGYANGTSDANGDNAYGNSNALGWKLNSIDGNGHTTTDTYDNWGRVTTVTAPDGTASSVVYDPNGNVLRASDANAAPLTFSGNAAWTPGLSGSALSLDGSVNTFASTGSNHALGNFGVSDFTVSLWVRTTSAALQSLVLKRAVPGHASFWDFYLNGGAACCEVDGDTSGTNYLALNGIRRVNDGAWHHLSFVRSGATLTTFVDGTQDVTATGPGTANVSNTSALTVGYNNPYNGNYLAGALDEMRLYNRALSGSEIASLAQNSPLPSAANQLQSYWHFDEGSGTTAYDACHSVVNAYDADDRLTQTTNGRGDVVTYTYDGSGQKGLLSSKTDGNGHATYYSYTARNEPAATSYADSTSESVTYDENGNTKTRTKADGKVITYTYDADNRLTDITYPTLAATHFDYDADSRRTHMRDATGDTSWTYGDGLHLTMQQTPQGTVTYGYDTDSRRTSMAAGPGAWTYGYDYGGRLHTLQSPNDGTTTFAYDAANRPTQKTKGNGEYETYAYDAADQLTGIGYYWADTTWRNGLTYAYDPAGNVSVCNQGWYATYYGYDGADQLTSEILNGTNFAYTYDHNGNRLTQTQNGSPNQSFTYDAHDKLTSGSGETDTYDPNGSETSISLYGSLYQFFYDDEDRLIKATYPGGIVDTFTYNGLRLRVGKTDSTGTYAYLCDGTTPGASVLTDGHATYTPGLSENRGGVSSYYAHDNLGNLWAVDAANNVQAYFQDTTAFGSPVSAGGSTQTPFKFGGANGCQTDADIGLVLMGHRYYDTRVGRFITQDPAGDGDNWYAYAGNSPTNGIDPSGLFHIDDMGTIMDGGGVYTNSASGQPPGQYTYADGTPYTVNSDGSMSLTASKTIILGRNSGGGDVTGPSAWQDAGAGFGVGFSAVGSAASFHHWDGGAAKNDPSFGVSRGLADVGMAAGTAAFGGEGAEGAEATTGCFQSGTPVQVQGKTEPIQTIRKGEVVATRNLQTGKMEYRKVVRTFAHLAHDTITAQFADAKTGKVVETVTGTPEHPFYMAGRGFVALGSLGVGTLVVTRAGPSLVVKSLARHHFAMGVLVYNLEVEGDHTYFVGNTDGGV